MASTEVNASKEVPEKIKMDTNSELNKKDLPPSDIVENVNDATAIKSAEPDKVKINDKKTVVPVKENEKQEVTSQKKTQSSQKPPQQTSPKQAPQKQPPLNQENQNSATKARTSREEKQRKKDDKSVDHVLKALNSLKTTEEKLAAMCKKYADLFDDNRKVQLALKQAEKKCTVVQREKELLQTDHNKAVLTKSKLENLCRELQRQNKAIKEESLLKIREEEEKRKEVSDIFQTTLNEITTLMNENNDKNMKLRDDNLDMNAKLRNVCEQYELREQQVDKISKQMQLEAQLADAKLAKAQMEMAAERELMLQEKQQLLLELTNYQKRCQELQTIEIDLRTQISLYDEKYNEFQKALTRSNEVFGGFKTEMEKMNKKVSKLEREVSTWKQRWEGSHKALLELSDEKKKTDDELNQAKRQVNALKGLCQTLQGERANLMEQLKGTNGVSIKNENNKECPTKEKTAIVGTVDKPIINETSQENETINLGTEKEASKVSEDNGMNKTTGDKVVLEKESNKKVSEKETKIESMDKESNQLAVTSVQNGCSEPEDSSKTKKSSSSGDVGCTDKSNEEQLKEHFSQSSSGKGDGESICSLNVKKILEKEPENENKATEDITVSNLKSSESVTNQPNESSCSDACETKSNSPENPVVVGETEVTVQFSGLTLAEKDGAENSSDKSICADNKLPETSSVPMVDSQAEVTFGSSVTDGSSDKKNVVNKFTGGDGKPKGEGNKKGRESRKKKKNL